MDGMDLLREQDRLLSLLTAAVAKLSVNGRKLAEAERDYQKAKRARVLALKAEGASVGLIDLTIKGEDSVAEKLFARDIEEANYKANQEYINATKLEIKVISDQIAREWSMTKNE